MTLHRRDETTVVELKEGQDITVSCSPDAKFSECVIPISSGSPKEIGVAPGSAIFVGQYLFTGSENTSAFLTAKEVRCLSDHGIQASHCC